MKIQKNKIRPLSAVGAILKKCDDFLSVPAGRINNFFTAKRILAAAIILLVIHAVISLFFNYQIYRDVGGVYAWYAAEFGKGIWWSEPISKVPPLHIFLGGLLVRCGVEAYSSIITVSLIFMGLTLFPLYKMLKLYLPERMAALGCLFFAFAPRLLRFSGTGLLESARDFFLVAAFYLLFKSWNRECKWHHWCLLGFSLGLLTLARGEGIVMAGAVALGLLIHGKEVWSSGKLFFQKIFKPCLIAAVCALAVMAPTLYHNYVVTGYPVTDARMIGVIRIIPGIKHCFSPKETVSGEDPRLLPHTREPKGSASSWKNSRKRLFKLPHSVSRGANEAYLVLTILGLIAMLKAREWRKEYSFLLGYCLFIPFCFIFFSVSHRYFIFYIPLLMVFTLRGMCVLLSLAGRIHAGNCLGVILGTAFVLQPLHPWLWMTDKSEWDELHAREFVLQKRSELLPENATRKLIIHADSRILFRCGEDRLFHYGEYIPSLQYVTGFDLLFVPRKDKAAIDGCRARQDLRQLETSFRDYVVFAPRERRK